MIDLVMALHCHQPVGNFDHVFDKATTDCYRPILELAAAHPTIRMGMHFSGPLLEWLDDHRPDTLDLLAELVQRGQVEPMSGGFYEPLLATIPQRDARDQVLMMNDYIRRRFGRNPTGFWLTERIWDASLPLTLHGTGMRYTVVDDTHFYYAGLTPDQVFGRYVTEKEGRPLSLLATPMIMRYLIPFKSVEEVIGHLRGWDEAGRKVAVYGDDGEKFGVWPGTHEWVIQKGWLERFFTSIEQSADWLRTVTPGEYEATSAPLGRLYLPPASYEEMTEWALPPAGGEALEDLIQTLKNENRWENWRRFIRGGIWDNFLVKYDETNRMHKKMLFLSERAADDPQARRSVWRAQCNCAYWHGVFGGLYLGHLRRAIHEHLLRAQARLSDLEGGPVRMERLDYDLDGSEEVLLHGPALSVGLKSNPGGSLFELGHMAKALNLSDTLTRRHEAYHRRLQAAAGRSGDGQGFASIHDQVLAKEEGLDRYLVYDPYTRASLLDHFFDRAVGAEDLASGRYEEVGDFVAGPYEILQAEAADGEAVARLARTGRVRGGLLRVTKTVRIGRSPRMSVTYTLENLGAESISAVYGTEFNLTLYSDRDEQRYYLSPEYGRRREAYESGSEYDLTRFDLVNGGDGLRTIFTVSRPVEVHFFPLMTVSMSEEGFEKSYQGTALYFTHRIDLAPGRSEGWELNVELSEM